MIIYHWSSIAPPQSNVENFTALATFRAYYTGSLWVYAGVIVALGAMGSALQALLAAQIACVWNPTPTQINSLIILFLALVLYGLVLFSRRKS